MRKIPKRIKGQKRPIDPTKIKPESRFGIPHALEKWIKNTYNTKDPKTGRHDGVGNKKFNEFKKWWGSIQASQKDEINVLKEWNMRSNVGGKANLWTLNKAPRGQYSPHKSHIQAYHSGGSGYSFLEFWKYNAARANTEDKPGIPFIDPKLMEEAGLPKNWYELFYAWEQQKLGNRTSLGTLETINPDDLIALHRGDSVNKVKERRDNLDRIYELAINDPSTITDNAERYNAEFARSRGLNIDNHVGEHWLKRHTGWDQDKDFNWVKVPEKYLERDYIQRSKERFSHPGNINYSALTELQPEAEITGAMGAEQDPSQIDSPPKHQWFTNPFSTNLPKPEYDEAWQKANKPIRQLRDLSIKGIVGSATGDPLRFITPSIGLDATKSAFDATDQSIGEGIRQTDKLLNQSYAERINPDSYITNRQLDILNELFPDD